MFLKALQLENFRNYDDVKLDFGKNIILIIGDNGLGKTNLLEAIQYVSSGKSHRTSSQDEMIRWGQDFALIRAYTGGKDKEDGAKDFCEEINEGLIELELNPLNKTKIRVNGAVCKKKSDFISILPSVIFSPEDLSIVKGGPSLRRGFMDDILDKLYPDYSTLCLKYQKILNQRNSLIKCINNEKNLKHNPTLEAWNENLVKYGTEIIFRRVCLLGEIKDDFSRIFGMFFKSVNAELFYIFSWDRKLLDQHASENTGTFPAIKFEKPGQSHHGPGRGNTDNNQNDIHVYIDKSYISNTFKEKLKENFNRELSFKNTLTGPHRDDFLILLKGKAIKSFGSQGQQRIAAVCLKFCELELLRKRLSKDPVLLLDDVLSELDSKRENQVLNLIGNKFQTFITTSNINYINDVEGTEKENIQKFVVADNKVLSV